LLESGASGAVRRFRGGADDSSLAEEAADCFALLCAGAGLATATVTTVAVDLVVPAPSTSVNSWLAVPAASPPATATGGGETAGGAATDDGGGATAGGCCSETAAATAGACRCWSSGRGEAGAASAACLLTMGSAEWLPPPAAAVIDPVRFIGFYCSLMGGAAGRGGGGRGESVRDQCKFAGKRGSRTLEKRFRTNAQCTVSWRSDPSPSALFARTCLHTVHCRLQPASGCCSN
jgi:hypothetical protein